MSGNGLRSISVIRSFRSKALRRFAETGDASKLSVQNVGRLEILLRRLDSVQQPEHMNLPGFHFHPLKGRDRDRYSVRVTGNYRLTFGWDAEDAVDIDLEDYH
ncbi:MAG TPA: type II toxin-antitoxin system RelE/ParE family toxin [Rhizomicrobium sp.]|jgi:proteic killer suppression protein|nr:type II toxin-antitoxin system RelE/ParE family toxin [Rhizomicrobium sp.]